MASQREPPGSCPQSDSVRGTGWLQQSPLMESTKFPPARLLYSFPSPKKRGLSGLPATAPVWCAWNIFTPGPFLPAQGLPPVTLHPQRLVLSIN